jgi:hypothetical protein
MGLTSMWSFVDKGPPSCIHGVAHLDGWESTLLHQSIDLAAARGH